MQSDVPPDFFGVVDATGSNEQLAVILVFRERLERIRNAGSGKTLEYFQAITFQPRVLTHPEWRVDGQCVYVRQKITGLIHYMDRRLPIGNADVHVQSENQIRPRERLHVLDDFLVSLAFSNELIAPV